MMCWSPVQNIPMIFPCSWQFQHIMETHKVHLGAFSSHNIFVGARQESYSEPLPGSVTVTVASPDIQPCDYPAVSVRLLRTVASKPRCCSKMVSGYTGLREAWRRRRSSPGSPCPTDNQTYSTAQTAAQCDLWCTPDSIERDQRRGLVTFRYTFGLPIPAGLPPTVETAVGCISYSLVAMSKCHGRTAVTTPQVIEIKRYTIPGHLQSIQHGRTFRGDRIKIMLEVTPDHQTPKSSYYARIYARRTITEGPRATEMRHVVVKEVKWKVDETVKLLSIPDSATQAVECQEQYVRPLCRDNQTGRWSATGGVRRTQATEDMIDIPFAISIGSGMADVALAAYNLDARQQHPDMHRDGETSVILVSHQLTVDIVTAEDTIDQVTGRLVDRKPLWKSFSVCCALPVYDSVSPNIDLQGFVFNEVPLPYDEESSPPAYENYYSTA